MAHRISARREPRGPLCDEPTPGAPSRSKLLAWESRANFLSECLTPEHLLWAEQRGCVLISSGARTMLGHFAVYVDAGRLSPGVFLIALPTSIPEILEALFYYADAADDDSWRDQVVFTP